MSNILICFYYSEVINKIVISFFVVGLALGIALVSRWHVGQWQVPKALARIFLGCRAVGDC
jgi:hypothetical protein